MCATACARLDLLTCVRVRISVRVFVSVRACVHGACACVRGARVCVASVEACIEALESKDERGMVV